MRLGLPSFLRNVERSVERRLERTVTSIEKSLPGDLAKLRTAVLVAFNPDFKKLTARPNVARVKDELGLAAVAADPKSSNAAARKALLQMRALMGAEPLDQLDPLPAACSTQTESARTKSAQPWDPSALSNAPGTWATRDRAGKTRSDPVNLYVHGDLATIVKAFQRGGWSIADPLGAAGDARFKNAAAQYFAAEAEAAATGTAIPPDVRHAVNRMPVSTLYLDGQPELVSLEANNHPLTGRDHFRIFWTGKKDAQGQNVYAIAASRDEGLKLDPRRKATAYTNHFTERNADRERDFVLQTLRAGGARISGGAVQQKVGRGPAGGLFSKDGKVYDLTVG